MQLMVNHYQQSVTLKHNLRVHALKDCLTTECQHRLQIIHQTKAAPKDDASNQADTRKTERVPVGQLAGLAQPLLRQIGLACFLFSRQQGALQEHQVNAGSTGTRPLSRWVMWRLVFLMAQCAPLLPSPVLLVF